MSERSMGVLQEADEERARRKDNPDDWPQIKARLEQRVSGGDPLAAKSLLAADIRAALAEVEFQCGEVEVRDEALQILRQRMEELEASDRESLEMYRRCRERADAAEAKLAKVVGALTYAFDQHGCFCGSDDNADWTYGKKWVHHACCPVGVAIDMARGSE